MSHEQLEYRQVLDKVNGLNHITFSVGSKENVIALTERLTNDGYTLFLPFVHFLKLPDEYWI